GGKLRRKEVLAFADEILPLGTVYILSTRNRKEVISSPQILSFLANGQSGRVKVRRGKKIRISWSVKYADEVQFNEQAYHQLCHHINIPVQQNMELNLMVTGTVNGESITNKQTIVVEIKLPSTGTYLLIFCTVFILLLILWLVFSPII
ncbi:MAG: hypothetical protein AAFR36_28705, partial [Bacteroidota bacterium]